MLVEKCNDLVQMEKDLCFVIVCELDNVMVFNVFGYILVDCIICYGEVCELIFKVYKLNLDDLVIFDSMGWINYCQGKLVDVECYLCQVLQCYFDYEVVVYLGEVFWVQGCQGDVWVIWCEYFDKQFDSDVLCCIIKCLIGVEIF